MEAGTCLQKMIGNVRTGVILKDVSMEVHGGELSAVLGSKGNSNWRYHVEMIEKLGLRKLNWLPIWAVSQSLVNLYH